MLSRYENLQGRARCAGAAQGRAAGMAALAMERELAPAASPQRRQLRVGADGALGETLAGLPEVAAAEPLSASGLKVRLAADRPARLAYQSWARTYPFSVARHRDQLLRKTAEFAYRAVRELHHAGESWLGRLREMRERPSPPRTPGVADATRILARLARRGVERALNIEQWFLAYRFGGRVQAGLEGFTRILPPKDRDWADPFVVEKSGRYYIFFEELIYAEGKAHIAMLELDRAGRTSTPTRVLEADYHLSYPYVFEHDGQLWMLPESARNRRVELYRCVDFPLSWKREQVLLEDVRLVDATLRRSGERRERPLRIAHHEPGGRSHRSGRIRTPATNLGS